LDIIATNALDHQPLRATPAVDGGALIIRTENYLYRIENAVSASAQTGTEKARNEPDRKATLRLTAERRDINLSINQPAQGKETTP
jgi:hypothetical protein